MFRKILILLVVACFCIIPLIPNHAFAVLAKTTSIVEVDAWNITSAATLDVGNAHDVSASYDSLLYIEVALGEAVAQIGVEVIIEISYADDNWVKLISFTGTTETAATTTINDGSVTAGDTTITLTDSTTGDFDDPARKWFILDGTVGNSESVKTQSNATNTVTICQDLIRSHADSLNVYDRVDEWVVSIPTAAAFVRTLINNVDTDCDVYFTTRISKVTGL